jgi:hypothetical protein
VSDAGTAPGPLTRTSVLLTRTAYSLTGLLLSLTVNTPALGGWGIRWSSARVSARCADFAA